MSYLSDYRLEETTPEHYRNAYYEAVKAAVTVVDTVVVRLNEERDYVCLCRPGSDEDDHVVNVESGGGYWFAPTRISDADVEFDVANLRDVSRALRERRSGGIAKRVGVDFVDGFAYFYSVRNTHMGRDAICPVTLTAVDKLASDLEDLERDLLDCR